MKQTQRTKMKHKPKIRNPPGARQGAPPAALSAVLILAGLFLFLGPLIWQVMEVGYEAQVYDQLILQAKPTFASAPNIAVPSVTIAAVGTAPTTEVIQVPPAAEAQPIDEAWSALEPAIQIQTTPQEHSNVIVPEQYQQSSGTNSQQEQPPDQAKQSPVDLAACLAQNKDFIAWLYIPGTKVDYPVVLSDKTDYYLTHLFTGKASKLGCLFSLQKTDYRTPGRNIAIYGHHITSNNNVMFSPLLSYKKQSFYANHAVIQLDSLYRSSQYRIFAVINMDKDDWDASSTAFASNQDFLSFVNKAKAYSLYDTGVAVGADDHILTLITCDRSYGGKDGRLIVMAVEQ